MSGQFKVVGLNKVNEHWGDSEKCFLVQLHCELVQEGAPGGEAFQVTVVSPKQLEKEIPDNEFELGRGYLLAREYDEQGVKRRLQKFVDGSDADSWTSLAEYVQKYFDWV